MDEFFNKVNQNASDVRWDKYIMKKVRVVPHACDTPAGPSFHPYQILKQSTE